MLKVAEIVGEGVTVGETLKVGVSVGVPQRGATAG
jgi:hypothetical protein